LLPDPEIVYSWSSILQTRNTLFQDQVTTSGPPATSFILHGKS
jgi:hypothetical protein